MPYDIIVGRSPGDKERFGNKGLIYLGKGYVQMRNYTSLSNKLYVDVAGSHVILVAGKRGSGKSYTLGVMAEEISSLPKEVSQNIAPLIFDTMGIYWTMKYKNEKEKDLLDSWDLQSKNLPVKVFVPFGHFDDYLSKQIAIDESFALDVTEMNPEDWALTFNLNYTHPVSVIISRTITKLKQKEKFDIDDIIAVMEKDTNTTQETKNAAIGLFEAVKTWGIFASNKMKPTQIKDLLNPGITTVLDLSVYNSVGAFNIRALVISLVSRKIFNERMVSRKKEETQAVSKGLDYLAVSRKRDIPMVWLMIDEAHEFLPKDQKTSATDALIQLLREGRQPGISLVLATQQPGQIHKDVMTQSDIVISHRLTSEADLDALEFIMQSYVTKGIKQIMNELPHMKGSAIILDDNSERIYPVRVHPRFTWHGGEAPTAIKVERRL
jgi:hypothetical protein